MKKTCLILATVTTLILLSCNHIDNSISSAEDVNKPQTLALKLASQDDMTMEETPSNSIMASGSSKLTSSSYWGIAGVPVGYSAWSNELYFNFTAPPTNATNTSYTFCPGAVSVNKGAFSIDYLDITCGNYYTLLPWNGSGCVSTTVFVGDPARTPCYVSFHGKCTSGYYEINQMVNMCNKSNSGGNLTNYYQY